MVRGNCGNCSAITMQFSDDYKIQIPVNRTRLSSEKTLRKVAALEPSALPRLLGICLSYLVIRVLTWKLGFLHCISGFYIVIRALYL